LPDLLTHFLSAYILGRWTIPSRAMRSIFYFGAILPDLFSRAPVILLELILKRFPREIFSFFVNFHSPFVVFWFSVLISQFFQKDRRKIFFLLSSGAIFHFILDFFQKHIEPVYFWLFPFSWQKYEIGLFWSDSSIYAIPFLLGIIIVVEGIFFLCYRKKRNSLVR